MRGKLEVGGRPGPQSSAAPGALITSVCESKRTRHHWYTKRTKRMRPSLGQTRSPRGWNLKAAITPENCRPDGEAPELALLPACCVLLPYLPGPWEHKLFSKREEAEAHPVVATRSGKQNTQKDNADGGVQFITTAGPRQSRLLAKDPDQFL